VRRDANLGAQRTDARSTRLPRMRTARRASGIAGCVPYFRSMDLINRLRAAVRGETSEDVERLIDEVAEALGERPVVATGGDCAGGEVVRGDVFLVDYDEAEENREYAHEMLAEAEACKAPDVVIESLRDIIAKNHS